MLSAGQLPDEWRRLVIERLEPFGPEKIIVFGSRARGAAREHSDIDLLVVLEGVDGDGKVQSELSVRYPGAEPDASRSDAQEALAAAHELVEAAREDTRS